MISSIAPRLLAVAGALAISLTPAAAQEARPDQADQGPRSARPGHAGQTVVAVLPLAAADQRMRIYGPPVANALAERLGAQDGLRVEALSLTGMLPARVDLVIDGSVVTAPSGQVLLEARVRDPERGTTVAAVATDARPLTEIDRLAADLAAVLAPRLRAAVAARERRDAAGTDQASTAATGTTGTAARSRAPRPPLVVFGATGQAAGGVVPVEPDATRTGHRLARMLGYRPVAAAERGIVPPATAVAALRRTGAALGLMLRVQEVTFSWNGVLMARGRVRAVLVDAAGRSIYDRTHRTGTLVGNRGDRHSAVVRLVMDQTADILAPALRRALAAREALAARGRAGAGKPSPNP